MGRIIQPQCPHCTTKYALRMGERVHPCQHESTPRTGLGRLRPITCHRVWSGFYAHHASASQGSNWDLACELVQGNNVSFPKQFRKKPLFVSEKTATRREFVSLLKGAPCGTCSRGQELLQFCVLVGHRHACKCRAENLQGKGATDSPGSLQSQCLCCCPISA